MTSVINFHAIPAHLRSLASGRLYLIPSILLMTSSITIATVDYADYTSGDDSLKQAFIQKLGDAFSEIGFAIVENHGVSEDLKQRLFSVTRAFFELDDDVKQSYEDPILFGQRGYIGKDKEKAKGRVTPDLKEFYHIGQEVAQEILEEHGYPENVWPQEISDFREICLEVYHTFEETGRNLLRALAIYLELEENYFDDKIENGNSILRLLHYYPLDNAEDIAPDAVRAAAHGDINLITLLMGASAKGLQAQTADGEWIHVSPKPNQIVINMGDMMQRLTNGRLKSTIHRVINPGADQLSTSRYSTPFFLHPRSDMDLTCLDSCVSEENPKQFADMTAGEYLDERLLELGLKPA